MFELVDSLHGLAAHKFDSVLVAQVIAAFDRVVRVPLRMIFFQIP